MVVRLPLGIRSVRAGLDYWFTWPHRIHRGETCRGLATLCVGGGMGIAAAVEQLN